MGKHTVIWRRVVQVPFKAKFSGFSFTALHIAAHHFFDAALHGAPHLQNDMVMVGHDLVCKDFYFWAKFKHPLLLVD